MKFRWFRRATLLLLAYAVVASYVWKTLSTMLDGFSFDLDGE